MNLEWSREMCKHFVPDKRRILIGYKPAFIDCFFIRVLRQKPYDREPRIKWKPSECSLNLDNCFFLGLGGKKTFCERLFHLAFAL